MQFFSFKKIPLIGAHTLVLLPLISPLFTFLFYLFRQESVSSINQIIIIFKPLFFIFIVVFSWALCYENDGAIKLIHSFKKQIFIEWSHNKTVKYVRDTLWNPIIIILLLLKKSTKIRVTHSILKCNYAATYKRHSQPDIYTSSNVFLP